MKKLLSLLVVGALTVSLCACGGSADASKAPAAEGESAAEAEDTADSVDAPAEDGGQEPAAGGVMLAIAKEDIKVGVIHITDPAEGSGYTYTHDLGIQGMQKNIDRKSVV